MVILKRSEETISMLLGLAVVIAVVVVIINYFQKTRGEINLPGISTELKDDLPVSGGVVLNKGKEGVVEERNTYEVKRGESLWKIAEILYGDGEYYGKIAEKNQIKDPGLIFTGQILILPENVQVAEKVSDEKYVVKGGDCLWNIAQSLWGDGYKWVDLWQLNKTIIANPALIEPGMVLALVKDKDSLIK